MKRGNGIKSQLFWKVFLPVILAIPAALIIKIFFLTSYHVPTASMASTIIPGDHILVEKYLLGTRFFIKNKVYRTPGIRSVKSGDLIVFNVPKEDTITPDVRYYTSHSGSDSDAGENFHDHESQNDKQFAPIPFRTPFVKRAIGLPGDTVRQKHHEVWINHQRVKHFAEIHQEVIIRFDQFQTFEQWKNKLYHEGERVQMNRGQLTIAGIFKEKDLAGIDTTDATLRYLTHFPPVDQIPDKESWAKKLIEGQNELIIPYKGWTVTITPEFLQTYGSLIRRFENHTGQIDSLTITDASGKKINQYTFRQNYYWCLGDNRPFSIDSRHWGLVPEDHIIGLSRRTMWSRNISSENKKSKVRWDRLYRTLK